MRKRVTSRFNRGSLFDKRIVITLPRSGVVMLALATGAALVIPPVMGQIMTGVAVIITIVAIATVAEARYQLRTFKHEMQERIVAWMDIPDEPDLRNAVDDIFKGVNDASARRVRLPGQDERRTSGDNLQT
jgi:steroid 5-alpha reductase family enzyme